MYQKQRPATDIETHAKNQYRIRWLPECTRQLQLGKSASREEVPRLERPWRNKWRHDNIIGRVIRNAICLFRRWFLEYLPQAGKSRAFTDDCQDINEKWTTTQYCRAIWREPTVSDGWLYCWSSRLRYEGKFREIVALRSMGWRLRKAIFHGEGNLRRRKGRTFDSVPIYVNGGKEWR